MNSISTYRLFGSVLVSALCWCSHTVWADERRQSSVDGKSNPYQLSDDGRVFCETLKREELALAQAPVSNLIAIVRKPLQDEEPLSEVEGAIRTHREIRRYSGAAWYLGAELMRHFSSFDKKAATVPLETIRDLSLKGEAFDLLMKRDAGEAWAYVREKCSSRATLTDALIGDRLDRNRHWYGAGNWQSVFEGTNVVFRYVAIARLREWCPSDQRGRIVRSALDDPDLDIREGAIDSLQLLDSKTAVDCARAYLLKWTGRSSESLNDGERGEEERLLQRAQYMATNIFPGEEMQLATTSNTNRNSVQAKSPDSVVSNTIQPRHSADARRIEPAKSVRGTAPRESESKNACSRPSPIIFAAAAGAMLVVLIVLRSRKDKQ